MSSPEFSLKQDYGVITDGTNGKGTQFVDPYTGETIPLNQFQDGERIVETINRRMNDAEDYINGCHNPTLDGVLENQSLAERINDYWDSAGDFGVAPEDR